jgi:hypothetical protein
MGAESGDTLGGRASGANEGVADYCREIERYLCQKNDGHLIRVVGPSFDLVSNWAADGVPLKIAFEGIDRHFERYYRRGPRRRPVRIDHCAADVLDVFDEWRRAVGIGSAATPAIDNGDAEPSRGASLPAHLERVLLKLSTARASGVLDAAADHLLDRVSGELDLARASPGGVRGDARRRLRDRLAAVDRELVQAAYGALDEATLRAIEGEAHRELEGFRTRMEPDQFARAHRAAADRLVRERLGLPVVIYP